MFAISIYSADLAEQVYMGSLITTSEDAPVHSVKRRVLNGSESSGQERQRRLCN